jgi:hypothetical protein
MRARCQCLAQGVVLDDCEQLVDVAFLEQKAAIHVDFGEFQLGVGCDFFLCLCMGEADGDCSPASVTEYLRAGGAADGQPALLDDLGEKSTQGRGHNSPPNEVYLAD